MARLKKKTIIFGSSSDIGKKIKKILNKHSIFELNSKELDLSNIEKVKSYNINMIPDNIIFVSATNNPKDFLKLDDNEVESVFNTNFISFIILLKKFLAKNIKAKNRMCSTIIMRHSQIPFK